jgi:hypothetical protein
MSQTKMPANPQAFFLLIQYMTAQKIQIERWIASKKIPIATAPLYVPIRHIFSA